MIKIENHYLKVQIYEKGAELSSIFDIQRNLEILWQADSRYWAKKAPILFPIVGALKNGSYFYNDKAYELPRHGFARDQVFEIETVTAEKAVLSLTSSSEMSNIYPFKFKLYVTYTLENQSLIIDYSVVNLDQNNMFFSIGAHPAFNCNLASEKCILEILTRESLDQIESLQVSLDTGLIKEGGKMIPLQNNALELTPDLFKEDALIFEGRNITGFVLRSEFGEALVKFECIDYPYIGIWSPEAPFVCLEPWYGIADFENTTQDLTQKREILSLDKGGTFNCQYKISV